MHPRVIQVPPSARGLEEDDLRAPCAPRSARRRSPPCRRRGPRRRRGAPRSPRERSRAPGDAAPPPPSRPTIRPMSFRFAYGRKPTVALDGMVATSQPLATRAGLRMLERGRQRGRRRARRRGGALRDRADVDRDRRRLLRDRRAGDGARRPRRRRARAGAAPTPLEPVAERGPRSVTVPGAVAGWAALAERPRPPRARPRASRDAIDAAERGFAAGWHVSDVWQPRRRHRRSSARRRRSASAYALPELARDAARDRRGRARRLLPRPGRRGDRRGQLARGGRSRRAIAPSLGRAAAARPTGAPRSSSCRRPARASPRSRRSGCSTGSSRPSSTAVACARLALEDALAARPRRRRRGAICSTRTTSRAARATRPGRPRARPAAPSTSASSTPTAWPSRSSRASSRASARSSSPPARGSRCRTAARASPSPGASSPGGAPTTRSSRGCSCATAACSAPSGTWAGSSRRRRTCSSSPRSSTTGSTPRPRSTGPRFRVDGDVVRLEEGLWGQAAELEAAGMTVVLDDNVYGFGGGQIVLLRGRRALGGLRPAQGRVRRRALTRRSAGRGARARRVRASSSAMARRCPLHRDVPRHARRRRATGHAHELPARLARRERRPRRRGLGAAAQLRRAGSEPGELEAIVLTHWHPDHVAGLPTLLRRGGPAASAAAATCTCSRRRPPAESWWRALRWGSLWPLVSRLDVVEPGETLELGTLAASRRSRPSTGRRRSAGGSRRRTAAIAWSP